MSDWNFNRLLTPTYLLLRLVSFGRNRRSPFGCIWLLHILVDVEQNFLALMSFVEGAHLTKARHYIIIKRSCVSYGPITPNWSSYEKCHALMCHSRQIICQKTLQYLYTTALKLIYRFLKYCPKRHMHFNIFFETGRLASLGGVMESRSLFSSFLVGKQRGRRQQAFGSAFARPSGLTYFGLPRNATVLQWISPGLQLPRWRVRAQFTTTAKASMQPAFFMPSLGLQV